jgi:hypothetical protein
LSCPARAPAGACRSSDRRPCLNRTDPTDCTSPLRAVKGMNDLLPAERSRQWEWFEAAVTRVLLAR